MMKRIKVFLSALAAMLCVSAQNPNFHIYLCIGQSNMEGAAKIEEPDTSGVSPRFMTMAATDFTSPERRMFEWYTAVPPLTRQGTGLGPSDWFGRNMVANLPDSISVGVITVAIGGCKIEHLDKDFNPDSLANEAEWFRNFMSAYDNQPYKRLVDCAKRAQQQGVIKGILLHQGESNNMQRDWPLKVKKVYTDLLEDLQLDANDVPLLIGQLVTKDMGGACWAHNDVINSTPQIIPTAHVISAANLPNRGDGLHFTSKSYRILGGRYAKKMLNLLGYQNPTLFHTDTEDINAGFSNFVKDGNPLIKNRFTSDPAPLVYNGKLYLYTGHDESYDETPGKYGYNLTDWLCYSTSDMVNWTDHGVILSPIDFDWAEGEAWAAQCVEKDGKFYFFVSTQAKEPYVGKAVGVAVADSPLGPFTDAIGRPLIWDSMTDNGERGWWNDIDPTVLLDGEDSWLCWGNGTCFLAKLKPNLTELDGEISVIDVPNFTEGPWLYKRDGKYYLIYVSMGEGRETIDYAMAPSMSSKWTHMGRIAEMPDNSFTIHPGVADFNGETHFFYHNGALELKGVKGGSGRRSVCVAPLYFNSDGSIVPVIQK